MPYGASGDSASMAKSVASYTYDNNGYWNGGTIYNATSSSTAANYFDTRYDVRHHINKNFELNVKYNPTENFQVTIDSDYVDSRATMSSITIYNMVKNKGMHEWSSAAGGGYYFPTAQPVNVTVSLANNAPSIAYDSATTSGRRRWITTKTTMRTPI